MTIEKLVQDTFHGRAALVRDGVMPARSSAVRARARAIRARRRASVVALATVAAVGVGAMVHVSSQDHADGPQPADRSDRVLSVRESIAGRSLVDSAESTDGSLSMRAGSARGAQWLLACSRVGSEYSLHVSVDGVEQQPATCDELAGLGDTSGFEVAPAGAGFESEVRLWVTRTGEEIQLRPAGAVLAVAAYALPLAAAALAGHDIYPLEANFGTEWSVVTSAESKIGQRSVTLDVPVHEGATMLELLSSGSGDATVRLAVDGQLVHTVPAVYQIGGRSVGDMLSGGVAHRVTLWIPEDVVPPDAQLAIVVRERAS